MINIEKLILDVLKEQNVAGGAESVYGTAGGGSSQFSGKNVYGDPDDARIPTSLFGGKIFRRNISKGRKKRKKK